MGETQKSEDWAVHTAVTCGSDPEQVASVLGVSSSSLQWDGRTESSPRALPCDMSKRLGIKIVTSMHVNVCWHMPIA